MITIKQLLESKSPALYTTRADETIASALGILAKQKIGALLVMNGDALVGILSERDCAIKVALTGRRADETKVSDVMTPTVLTVDPEKTLEQCMSEMNDRDIRHLPVVEGGKVLGMVSIGDVSKELLKDQQRLIAQMEQYVQRGFRL